MSVHTSGLWKEELCFLPVVFVFSGNISVTFGAFYFPWKSEFLNSRLTNKVSGCVSSVIKKSN